MSDMSDEQRKAGRGVLSRYPLIKVEIARDGESTTLTPWRTDTEARGAGVPLLNKGTPAVQVGRMLERACIDLMGAS